MASALALVRAPLAMARRASRFLRRALAVPLLGVAYVVAMPLLWAWLRLGGRRPTGWIDRRDAEVGSLDRLRNPF